MAARDDLIAIPDDLLRSGAVSFLALFFMDFQGAPKRWWNGFGDVDHAGFTWHGLGDLISVSPVSSSYGLSASQVTFTLAATPEMLGLALAAKARVRNRQVIVYSQMVANDNIQIGATAYQFGQAIGSPFSVWSGTMQRMPWRASGPSTRSLTLECEGLFYKRNAPPFGMWTDADQQARYPGDIGFSRQALYAASGGYETKWRG